MYDHKEVDNTNKKEKQNNFCKPVVRNAFQTFVNLCRPFTNTQSSGSFKYLHVSWTRHHSGRWALNEFNSPLKFNNIANRRPQRPPLCFRKVFVVCHQNTDESKPRNYILSSRVNIFDVSKRSIVYGVLFLSSRIFLHDFS